MWCQGGQTLQKLKFSFHKQRVQINNITIRRRSTTRVFVVAVAVGGCSVWRWNGGWVSVHSTVLSCMWKRRVSKQASKQAAPSTYPRTWVWKLLHQCQRRVASGGCGGGSLTASGWPDSWEEHQILTKWKSNRSSLEAELTADTYFNRNRCKGNNHSWTGCQKNKKINVLDSQ